MQAAVRKRAVSFHESSFDGADEDETRTPTSADETADADVAHRQQERGQTVSEQVADASLVGGAAVAEAQQPPVPRGRHTAHGTSVARSLFGTVEEVMAELRAERTRTTQAAQAGSMLLQSNAALESEVKQLREQLQEARQRAEDASMGGSPGGGGGRVLRISSRTDTTRSFFGSPGEADHSPEAESLEAGSQAARRAETASLEDRIHEKEHELQEKMDECDELRRNYDRVQREQQRLREEHEREVHRLQEELQDATKSATSRSSPRRQSELGVRAGLEASSSSFRPTLAAAGEEEEHTSADQVDALRSKLDALHLMNSQLNEELRRETRRGADALGELQTRDEQLKSLQAEHEELHKMLQEAHEVKSKPGRSFVPKHSLRSGVSTGNLGQSMYAATMRGSPDDWDHRRKQSWASSGRSSLARSSVDEDHAKDAIANFEIEAPPRQQAMQAKPADDADRSQLLLDVPCCCCRVVLMRPGAALDRPLL